LSAKNRPKLKKKIEAFPKKPGIYFFRDKDQNIIYIGKARSLHSRVKSYFSPTPDLRVNTLLSETEDIDYILTGSEKEASFLENNFIQQYQPRFNLRLKDDKSFPYLKLALQDRYPGIYLTRRVEADGARYFGPFSPAHQARETIRLVSQYFGIRTCREKIPGTRKRPCLDYDLKLCSAPCADFVGEEEYKENVSNAILFLEGKVGELMQIVTKKMQKAAESEDFEKAARWRDLVRTLEHIKEKPRLISVGLEDKDIIGFSQEKKKSAIYVFLMRKGKVSEAELVEHKKSRGLSQKKLLGQVLSAYYRGPRDWPDKILLPFFPADKKRIEDEIAHLAGKKVSLIVPYKGKNKKLVELADRNADIALREKNKEFLLLEEAREILGLEAVPYRIEGIDISNTGGIESVGSLAVFEDGRPKKEEYRKFRIKTVAGPDDVASVREVIRRRYFRILREKKGLPDLILVDGGKGQLNAAKKALEDLGLEGQAVISLAKKEEVLFTPSRLQGIRLDRTSPVLKLFQNVRDEAHRFAVSYHRRRREKRSFASELDGIPGLGPKKKWRLLAKYRSESAIKKAPEEELARTVGKKVAAELLRALWKHPQDRA
jgi:excinuclease ABC subunit C